MTNNEQFYVTIPSTTSIDEFPANTTNSFKSRFPQRLQLNGSHWKVALSGVTLPDTTENIVDRLGYGDLKDLTDSEKLADSALETKNIFNIRAILMTSSGTFSSSFSVPVRKQDIVQNASTSSGETFMISIANTILSKFTQGLQQTTEFLVDSTTKKRCVPDIKIKTRGNKTDVVLDNSNLIITNTLFRPILSIRTDLALKMGWLKYLSNTYILGHNIVLEDIECKITTDTKFTQGFTNSSGDVKPCKIQSNMMVLCPAFTWHFTNLNDAFDKWRGSPARTLMVYSDVAASSIVGGQITDLLREVPYNRKERGTMYVEPKHLQFLPIRSNIMETIEVQFAEQKRATGPV